MRQPWLPWGRHVYREANTEADRLANLACDTGRAKHLAQPWIWESARRIRIFTDGAVNSRGSGCGIVVQGSGPPGQPWANIWLGSFPIHNGHTSVAAELIALYEAVLGLFSLVIYGTVKLLGGRVEGLGKCDVSVLMGLALPWHCRFERKSERSHKFGATVTGVR